MYFPANEVTWEFKILAGTLENEAFEVIKRNADQSVILLQHASPAFKVFFTKISGWQKFSARSGFELLVPVLFHIWVVL